jgi:hypothetical protein
MHNAVLGILDYIQNGCLIVPDGTQTGGSVTLCIQVYNESSKTGGIGSGCETQGDGGLANAPF